MKAIIDIKRLEWLIIEGESSYSDGRNSFEYELLLDLMRRLKVRVNTNAAYEKQETIYKAKRAKRPRGNIDQQPLYHFAWQIEVQTKWWGDWGKPELKWPCKTAKEAMVRMKRLRAAHEEDVTNDNCDYEDLRLAFKLTPAPKPKLP